MLSITNFLIGILFLSLIVSGVVVQVFTLRWALRFAGAHISASLRSIFIFILLYNFLSYGFSNGLNGRYSQVVDAFPIILFFFSFFVSVVLFFVLAYLFWHLSLWVIVKAYLFNLLVNIGLFTVIFLVFSFFG